MEKGKRKKKNTVLLPGKYRRKENRKSIKNITMDQKLQGE